MSSAQLNRTSYAAIDSGKRLATLFQTRFDVRVYVSRIEKDTVQADDREIKVNKKTKIKQTNKKI